MGASHRGRKPDLALAGDTGLELILSKKLQARLKPLFETRVRRMVYPIRGRNSEIELTIDKGTIAAGRRSLPICEVELELKRGDAAELFKVARKLAQQVPAQLTVTSKPERGYALIVGKKASAVGAAAVAISPDASCQTAFQISARACLHQIVANQNPTRTGDPEGVHQARVGLRRLRAAISLFGGMLRDPRSGTIERELKWITGELGPARDLDVFLKGVVTPATAGKSRHPGMATLTRDLRRKRREAFGRARSAIESDRFRALVLDVAAWIEAGDWTRKADKLARATRDQPIATAAAAEMQRRRKKIMKLGTKLVELDPARRHRMRIQAKKLRYASDFFGVTFPGKKAVRRRKEFIASSRAAAGHTWRPERYFGAPEANRTARRCTREWRQAQARRCKRGLRGWPAVQRRGGEDRLGSQGCEAGLCPFRKGQAVLAVGRGEDHILRAGVPCDTALR